MNRRFDPRLLLAVAMLALPSVARAANPTFESFLPGDFLTNGPPPWRIMVNLDNFQFTNNPRIRIVNISGVTGGTIWTNDNQNYRPLLLQQQLSATNITSYRSLIVQGAFITPSTLSTNLSPGTNVVNPFNQGFIWVTGSSATPADSNIQLKTGNGQGSHLWIENYSVNSGFTLFNGSVLADDPTSHVTLNSDWTPTLQGEAIYLIQDGRGWKEVGRQSSTGPAGSSLWQVVGGLLEPISLSLYPITIGTAGTKVLHDGTNSVELLPGQNGGILLHTPAGQQSFIQSDQALDLILGGPGGPSTWHVGSFGITPASDGIAAIGGLSHRIGNVFAGEILWGGSGATSVQLFDTASAAIPEGLVTADPGSVWRNTGGGAGTTLYVKETGTGNTGWTAIGGGGGGTTINPTDNVMPVRTSSSAFGDTPIIASIGSLRPTVGSYYGSGASNYWNSFWSASGSGGLTNGEVIVGFNNIAGGDPIYHDHFLGTYTTSGATSGSYSRLHENATSSKLELVREGGSGGKNSIEFNAHSGLVDGVHGSQILIYDAGNGRMALRPGMGDVDGNESYLFDSSGITNAFLASFQNRTTNLLRIAANAVWPNDATKYFDGTGHWSIPSGGGGGGSSLWTNLSNAFQPIAQYTNFYFGADSFVSATNNGQNVVAIGNRVGYQAIIGSASHDIVLEGYYPARAAVFTGASDISGRGQNALATSYLTNVADVHAWGNYPLYGISATNSSNIYGEGHSAGQLSTVTGSGNLFFHGNESGLSSYFTNSFDISAFNGALKGALFTNSANVAGILVDAGKNTAFNGSYNLLLVGTNSTAPLGAHDAAYFGPGFRLALQGQTNLIGDNGTAVTFNGGALAPLASPAFTGTSIFPAAQISSLLIGSMGIGARTVVTEVGGTITLDLSATNRYWSCVATGNLAIGISNPSAGNWGNVLIRWPSTNCQFTIGWSSSSSTTNWISGAPSTNATANTIGFLGIYPQDATTNSTIAGYSATQ